MKARGKFLLFITLGVIGVWLLFKYVIRIFGSHKAPSSLSEAQIKDAFKFAQSKLGYDDEYMSKIEQLCRLESGHFKSTEFKTCRNFGMRAFSSDFDYGWGSLKTFCNKFNVPYSNYSTARIGSLYVKSNNLYYSIMFMAWFLMTVRKGNVYAWNSLDYTQQMRYKKLCDSITSKFF